MKKTLLFIVALLFSNLMSAQVREILISESFDNSGLPSGWDMSGEGMDNWYMSGSNNAGGVPMELCLYWLPPFDGVSRIITHGVDLSGIETLTVSFKHYLDNYENASSTIGIATSTDKTNWNTVWEQSYSQTQAYNVIEAVTSPDAGEQNVYFCLYFSGNSYNIGRWYFDDFEIHAQRQTDAKLANINFDNVISSGNHEISFDIQNMGSTTIESFTAVAEITEDDDTTTITETLESNVGVYEIAEFTFSETFFFESSKSYNIKLTITEVNSTSDNDPSNNSLEKFVSATMGTTQRIPMIEHFSSSTCGPCVAVNVNMNTLTQNNPGKFTYTKYQMDWPGIGDDYYTAEGGVRRDYYAVNSVPDIFVDGVRTEDIDQSMFDEMYNKPAIADVRGAFNVEGSVINITADFMSFSTLKDAKAFISINEKETTGNVGSNGEESFHHVFMKMLENAQGNTTTIEAGEYQRYEFSYDLSSTNVEDMNDLEVALWIQNPDTKEIYNSHFAYEYTEHCYPIQNLKFEIGDCVDFVYISYDAPAVGTPTAYNIYINNELVAENHTELSYSSAELAEDYMNGIKGSVTVVALYEDGKSSVGVSKKVGNFVNVEDIKQETSSCSIFPNPAKDFVKVSGNNIRSVNVYNSIGVLVDIFEVRNDNIEISTQNYQSGVYFINIEDNAGNNSTKKLIITE